MAIHSQHFFQNIFRFRKLQDKLNIFQTERLIMGKVEIDHWGYLDFFFLIFIEQSSVFHKNFGQIAKFDWLPGDIRRKFS